MESGQSKISLDAVSSYHASLKPFYDKALNDVLWSLNTSMAQADEIAKGIYNSSTVTSRVKGVDSLWKKCLRDGITSVPTIPEKVEDLIGIRVVTPNKNQAYDLFEFLKGKKDSWFCEVASGPKFTPYTIVDKNNYSLSTGYQAYHITFVLERSYSPFTGLSKWPTEIQISSKLWEFWANYSHDYFYRGSGAMVDKLLPFNVSISKTLDTAEDLMIATTGILLEEPTKTEVKPEKTGVVAVGQLTAAGVQAWLAENLSKYFDSYVKVPNPLFLSKIAGDLNLYGITLEKLGTILKDPAIQSKYRAILKASGVAYIPLYQQILCSILLTLESDTSSVIEKVNKELVLLGIRLREPSKSG